MSIKITTDYSGLKKLKKNMEELDGEHQVHLGELFSPEFVSKCSRFKDFNALFEASGFKVDSPEDFKAIPDDEWDDFTSKNTSYKNWEEMRSAAAAAYIKKRISL